MLTTPIIKYKVTIKNYDQGQDYLIKSVVSFVSLWWEDINAKEGGLVLVSKGVAGVE